MTLLWISAKIIGLFFLSVMVRAETLEHCCRWKRITPAERKWCVATQLLCDTVVVICVGNYMLLVVALRAFGTETRLADAIEAFPEGILDYGAILGISWLIQSEVYSTRIVGLPFLKASGLWLLVSVLSGVMMIPLYILYRYMARA
jgi:hypothetical protein